MARFDSYREPLRQVMNYLQQITDTPRIVEYGPGGSTKLMLKEAPQAHVCCIEHKKKWFTHYKEEFQNIDSRIQLYYKKKSKGYVKKYIPFFLYWLFTFVKSYKKFTNVKRA